jgi:hypothetical protein
VLDPFQPFWGVTLLGASVLQDRGPPPPNPPSAAASATNRRRTVLTLARPSNPATPPPPPTQQASAKLRDPATKKSTKITLDGAYTMHIMTNGSLAVGERVTPSFSGAPPGRSPRQPCPRARGPTPDPSPRTRCHAHCRACPTPPAPSRPRSVCADGYGGTLQTTDPTASGCSMCAAGGYGLGLGLRTGCGQCKVRAAPCARSRKGLAPAASRRRRPPAADTRPFVSAVFPPLGLTGI